MVGKARLALLNIVTAWNGDSANLTVVLPSTEVTSTVVFCWNLWILWFPGCFLKVRSYWVKHVTWCIIIWLIMGRFGSNDLGYCCLLFISAHVMISERAVLGAGKRRTAVRVAMVSHASTVLSCFLVEAECSMGPVVFSVKICYINFRIGIIVHSIDHNPHYCPLWMCNYLLNGPLLYLWIHYHIIH